ncbi:CAP domain-containing protein [Paenibacillus luteus]|uniref:CAP domain-containing protein n=1 Tax=Paenibacillus luteus TaxID=2545753 RepID=UPI0011445268|nr:CAP domain-containing protein [Paenibacillus luteus]
MKKLFLLLVLLLVAGCSTHSNKGTKPSSAANVTQASSITAAPSKSSTLSMKQNGQLKSKWTSDDLASAEYPADQAQTSIHYDQDVLEMVNAERAKTGLSLLVMDDALSKMALVKAQDLYNNRYFDHNSPTYGSPFDMMKKFQINYNAAGENIAKGQPTPKKVMNDWMNSAGHRANIMSSSFTKVGIAYFKSTWVQEFTG